MSESDSTEQGRRPSRNSHREHIVDAARTVFTQRGLDGARTKDIAKAAGTSEAVLYRNFRSKEEIFGAAMLGPLEDFSRSMATAGEEMPLASRTERHRMSYALHVELFQAMQVLGPMLNSAFFRNDIGGQQFYDDRLQPVIDQVHKSIAAAMTGWAYKGGDPELVTIMSLGTYHWLALQARLGHPIANTEEISTRFLDFIMRALEVRHPLDDASATNSEPTEPTITDAVWNLLEPLLPSTKNRGGQWHDHREILEAAAWKSRTGAPWRQIPRRFGAWQTVWKRLRRWQSDGTWDRLIAVLDANQIATGWMHRLGGPS